LFGAGRIKVAAALDQLNQGLAEPSVAPPSAGTQALPQSVVIVHCPPPGQSASVRQVHARPQSGDPPQVSLRQSESCWHASPMADLPVDVVLHPIVATTTKAKIVTTRSGLPERPQTGYQRSSASPRCATARRHADPDTRAAAATETEGMGRSNAVSNRPAISVDRPRAQIDADLFGESVDDSGNSTDEGYSLGVAADDPELSIALLHRAHPRDPAQRCGDAQA